MSKKDEMTKCRDKNAATLQQYANDKRIADQFNDVTVVAGSDSIPANILVLSCYLMLFKSMFLSPIRVWYGMEWKMEWKGIFGMEYGRCQNGMEWKISRMEWKTIFHTSIPIPYWILHMAFTDECIRVV